MGVYKIFSSSDSTLLFYSVFTFVSSLTQEETTANITVHISNYNNNFVLDNFSFIISKRLYHTSFKLNIVNFPKALLPWSSTEPTEGLTVPQRPRVTFYFSIRGKHRIFFLCG